MKYALLMSVVLGILTNKYVFADADSDNDPYRLDTAIQPTAQQLQLTLDPNLPRYSGSTAISLDIREAVDSVLLHAQDLTIRAVRFGPVGRAVAVEFAQLDHALLRISTGTTIQPGPYELRIDFEDDFNTDSVSLYRAEENNRFYIFSQMEASEAREAFPCFDEPAYKIPWSIILTVPEGLSAVSNTPVEETVIGNGNKTVAFAESPPMPSYLVAIAVGDFEFAEIPGLEVPGRVVTTPGKSALTALAVESTPGILAALESYFGIKYPYKKVDLIATPEFWYGAMENPGALVFLDRVILIDPANVDATRLRAIVATLSHELAHQWFGDLVTMEWWDDLWLNESFASWMGDKIVSQTHPELDIEKSRMSAIFATMDLDARPSSRPIRTPRKATDNFLNDIRPAYSKGRVIINMFEKAIGNEQFRAGIIEYMKRHRWGNADAADFAAAIGTAATFDVPKAFQSFINQPGLPQVGVELLDHNRLAVSQRRFTNAGDELAGLQWTIPLTIKYGIEGTTYTQSLVLDDSRKIIELGNAGHVQWIYPNADQEGYYRWKVAPQLLQPLIEHGQQFLTPMERMGLISNLTAMLYAGDLDSYEYLAALESFAVERDPYVLGILIDQLKLVRDALVSEEQKDQFAAMVGRLLGPALQSYGVVPVDGESNAQTSIRPRLLEWVMRDGRDAEILALFSRKADLFLSGDSGLHSSLVPAALLAAAITGNRETYDRFKKRFENARTPVERAQLLKGLAGFEAPEIIADLQQYSVSDAFRPRETMSIREELIKRPEPRDAVFDFALANYGTFERKLPGNGLAVLPQVTQGCSLSIAQRATVFFGDPEHQVAGTQRILDKAVAATRSCAALRARQIGFADDYFRDKSAAGM